MDFWEAEMNDEMGHNYIHGPAPEEADGQKWPRWEISGPDEELGGELGKADSEQMWAEEDSGHDLEESV